MRIINVTKNVDRLNLALTVEKRHLNSECKILGGGTNTPIRWAYVRCTSSAIFSVFILCLVFNIDRLM